jgi:hypothetical protein
VLRITVMFGILHTYISSGSAAQHGSWSPHSGGFYITQRRSTVSRTPLDQGSAGSIDLYLKTHNIQTERHPCSRRDSNPQSQQASGCRPTFLTARPLGKECMWPPPVQILNCGQCLNLPSICYSGSETTERRYT